MFRIAIFASGNGTNAANIIQYFANSSIARVVLVLSNNKDAKVLERAKRLNIASLSFTKEDLYTTKMVVDHLKSVADFVVLAGFLWRIPKSILKAFPEKVVNIHPALLPKYGGKGMFGMHVHNAVKQNQEKETGISIHYVNKNYDEGSIIFQKSIKVAIDDTPKMIAQKVHTLEYHYYPRVIKYIIFKTN